MMFVNDELSRLDQTFYELYSSFSQNEATLAILTYIWHICQLSFSFGNSCPFYVHHASFND